MLRKKYGEKAKLCYMDTDSFIVNVKTNYIYKDIAEDVETRSDNSNYELDRLLPKGKNKKVIGLMKDELGGKIMIKLVGLRAKTYSYLIDGGSKNKKAKVTKKCVIKRKRKLENHRNCLEASQLENKINDLEKNKIDMGSFFCCKRKQKEFIKNNKLILKTLQRFKSERYNDFTEEINKIGLSSDDDKRIQSIDSMKTYAYGMRKDLVSEKEEIKCKNIMKQYKKLLTLMMLQEKP